MSSLCSVPLGSLLVTRLATVSGLTPLATLPDSVDEPTFVTFDADHLV